LAFNGLTIFFLFAWLACLTEKCMSKAIKALGVKYKLDRTETRAADCYCQAKFDNKGSKKDQISGPPKDGHSDHSGII
jgi:hypothetical protein